MAHDRQTARTRRSIRALRGGRPIWRVCCGEWATGPPKPRHPVPAGAHPPQRLGSLYAGFDGEPNPCRSTQYRGTHPRDKAAEPRGDPTGRRTRVLKTILKRISRQVCLAVCGSVASTRNLIINPHVIVASSCKLRWPLHDIVCKKWQNSLQLRVQYKKYKKILFI